MLIGLNEKHVISQELTLKDLFVPPYNLSNGNQQKSRYLLHFFV
jgi:hypothetical protein